MGVASKKVTICFWQTRSGQCKCTLEYDGGFNSVFNINNSSLFHHGLMFLYLSSFVTSAQPLVPMWRTFGMMHTFAGKAADSDKFGLTSFKDAWTAFTDLLEVDADKLMVCNKPGCGKFPDTVILDGHALSLRQQLVDQALKDQTPSHRPDAPVLEGSRHEDRVLIRSLDPWQANHRRSLEHLQETLPVLTSALAKVRRWEGAFPQEVRLLIVNMLRIYNTTVETSLQPSNAYTNLSSALDKMACFPQWLVFRGLERYKRHGNEKELDAMDLCTKLCKGHPVLSSSIVVDLCPHGVCYGFSIMDRTAADSIYTV
uniref:Uncharacterized protein n=1 Tax=Plectus sambesii TaxID=2011161 RepID=A0A914VLF3_9BILA